jgi:hypothetical protein
MAATTHELALRYLLELSADIHAAALMDEDGRMLGSAPAHFGERAIGLACALADEARRLGSPAGESAVELDVTCEDGVVFVVSEPGRAMVCVTGRSVLAGLIFHDMHVVLTDLERAAGQGDLRATAATGLRGSAP